MKELTIEQKAKAYDEALRVLHKYDGVNIMFTQDLKEEMFPELKKSEDERIRKRIIHTLHGDVLDMEETAEAIAWLEKQSEQKSADRIEVEHLIPQKGMYYTCIKDYYSSDNTHLCVKGNVYKSFFNGYIDDESHLGLSWTNSCAEKYFEPTKDEDWIVCEHDNVIGKPMQYKEFKKKVNQRFIKNLKAQGLTPKLRLWNLRDAKDGDILCAKGSYFKEYLFMFSLFTEDNVISTHFGYDVFHGTFNTKLSRFGREEDFVSVTPVTKSQRETLFAKMKESGYEWNAEKKELKKIVVPIFNIGDTIIKKHNSDIHDFGSFTITDITGGKYWYNDRIICDITEQNEWEIYELVEQKPAWSEEDETYLDHVFTAVKAYYTDDKGHENPFREELLRWLKSLKDKYTWKPSDEQLKSLQELIDVGHFTSYPNSLETLYEQLKKLKGE